MLTKLALRNARRSLRDYLIYLMTMVLITAMMFAFNSMIFSDAVLEICTEAGMLAAMLGMATFFIVLIIIWLVHYMVKFMAEKRSREFATYLLLGFCKKQIANLFLKETILLGGVAFVIGLLPGVFLQQILTTLIYAMVNADYSIRLEWKIGTLLMTAGIYCGSYLLALFRNKRRFKKMNIRDMMYMDHQNEELKNGNKSGKQWMFFASVAFMLIFGWMLLFGRFNDWNVYPMILGLVVSVYLLYMGLSAFLIGYIKKGRAGVWNQANIFVLRQLSSKIRTMQFTLGTLTVLFMVALIGASCALMLNQFQNTQSDEKWPFDIAVYHQDPDYDFAGEKEAIQKAAEIKDAYIYQIFENESDDMNNFLIHNYSLADKSSYYKYDTYMKLSDYNYLRRMLGYPEVSLGEKEYLLHIKSRLAKTAAPFTEHPIDIGGDPYTCSGIYTEGFEQSGHNGADYILIVPDQTAESMKPYYSLLMAQINGTVPKDFGDTLLSIQGITWNEEEYEYEGYGDAEAHRGYGTDNIYVSDSYTFVRQNEMREMKFLMSTLIFPLFYIGLVFLCVALTVLAVQQLSDSSKYRYRYNLLRKLGLQEKELNSLILKQLFLYYLCPFIGALLISGGIAGYISHAFVTYSGVVAPVWSYFGLSLLLFGGIYMIYFIVTYIEFKRNILGGERGRV
ncbi:MULTISPECIES: FtsX-like permease family protein [Clostridia]|uniref:FtsX-like permease family protein n=1 Tax=Clostridia TaxID=186801 RepID=UPI00067E71DF|nr:MULTISPECIES: ABC transporter permease [Clostridia]